MDRDAQKIKDVLEKKQRICTHEFDPTTNAFIEQLNKDIKKTIQEKYPYVDVRSWDEENKDTAAAQARMLQSVRLKGYAFDSLVLRYEKARDAQMRYEQIEEHKKGGDGSRAKARADRDKMRFIQILDDVIGDHD